jgi:hypothetical protein
MTNSEAVIWNTSSGVPLFDSALVHHTMRSGHFLRLILVVSHEMGLSHGWCREDDATSASSSVRPALERAEGSSSSCSRGWIANARGHASAAMNAGEIATDSAARAVRAAPLSSAWTRSRISSRWGLRARLVAQADAMVLDHRHCPEERVVLKDEPHGLG